MGCLQAVDLVPGVGYVCTGACGERVTVPVGVAPTFPAEACPDFRGEVVRALAPAPKGVGMQAFMPDGLGRNPRSQAEPGELLDAYEAAAAAVLARPRR